MNLNPLATFDVLYIGCTLQRNNAGFTNSDIQLISYLSCLLFLYQKNPLSDWGYSFVGTQLGSPFSREIETALRHLQRAGHIEVADDRLLMKKSAEDWLKAVSKQNLFSTRLDCLLAAGITTTSFSLGIVREAMDEEVELGRVKRLDATRLLLEDMTLSLVYEQFGALRKALEKDYDDLRLPAMVWITALFEESRRRENLING